MEPGQALSPSLSLSLASPHCPAPHLLPPSSSWPSRSVLVCLTLCDPMDYILQARILEWVAFLFSRESPQPRNRTQVSLIAGRFFTS